eukprot:SM000157S02052  [mRNA]  locus=s157:26662:29437:+ [translate_table: standard]
MEPWAVALIPTAVLAAILLAAVILLVVGIFLQPRWLLRVVSRGLPHAVFYHDPPGKPRLQLPRDILATRARFSGCPVRLRLRQRGGQPWPARERHANVSEVRRFSLSPSRLTARSARRRLGGRAVNAVALTFDDSPCEHVTPQVCATTAPLGPLVLMSMSRDIRGALLVTPARRPCHPCRLTLAVSLPILDLLKANGCSATFFVIGSNFDLSPELIERIHAEGHEMGNHTMYDEPNWKLSAKEFEAQLLDVDARLQPYFFKSPDGKPIKWFRPGHGWFTPKMRKVFTKHGYRLALGSVYANDPLFTNSSGPIAAFFLWKMYPGAVIILHDRLPQKLQTLEVLQKILPVLRERGYSVTTLSDLLQLREGSVAVVQKPSATRTAASL